jgi:hypothetical protein
MSRRRHGILCCPSCRLWRSWHSFQERPRIDRHCIKCNKRIRVQLDRDPRGKRSWMHSQGRGRRRKVEIKEFPEHMPWKSVAKALRQHNKFERSGKRKRWLVKSGTEGFVQASKIQDRLVSLEEWETIERITMREVGESENEV